MNNEEGSWGILEGRSLRPKVSAFVHVTKVENSTDQHLQSSIGCENLAPIPIALAAPLQCVSIAEIPEEAFDMRLFDLSSMASPDLKPIDPPANGAIEVFGIFGESLEGVFFP